MVFEDADSAKKAQADLLTGGYEADEAKLIKGADFINLLNELKEGQSSFAILGSELEKTDEYIEHAEKGASFLVVFAQADNEVRRAMAVAERHGYQFAQKYGRLVIERL